MFFRFIGYSISIELHMDLPKDSIILGKTHPPMYLIHKYWARKPYNVLRAYIQKYTKPGDVVLDPFCGSGVTIAESVLANRNGIGVDINPFSIFLSNATITPVDIGVLERYIKATINQIQDKIDEFYGISCPFCNNPAVITQLIWHNTEKNSQNPPNEKIQEIRFRCPKCNIKNATVDPISFPSVYHQENSRVKQINLHYEQIISKYQLKIPKIPFTYRNGMKFKQIRHYLIQKPFAEQIFTKRNLIVLGILRSIIDKVIPRDIDKQELVQIRNLLLLTFTANIGQSSKMVWVISKRKSAQRKKKEVGSWTHHFFWNPHEFFEINPLIGFETRARKSIRAQKNLHTRMSNNNINSITTSFTWEEFQKSIGNKICLIHSSSELLSLPDESVDYIFTDPPYGDSIQYFELSTLWNNWLGFSTGSHEKNEIIINSNQQKTKVTYFNKLEVAFKECYRVLRNKSYMTLTFHNTDISIRNGLIQTIQKSGFQLDSLLFQMPPRNSLKSYLHYEKTPVGDYFLRFRKTISSNKQKTITSENKIAEIVKSTVREVLKQRGEPTNLIFLYNCIDEQLASHQSFPLEDSSIVEKTLDSMKKSNQIMILKKTMVWFTNPSESTNQILPLKERIKKYLTSIPDLKKLTYSDIYNSVYEKYYGWNTPDRKNLTEIVDKIKKSVIPTKHPINN